MDRKPHTFESLSRAVTQKLTSIQKTQKFTKALTPKFRILILAFLQ